MNSYKYTGINRFGKRVKGEMQANNPLDLEQRLKSTQIDMLSCKERKSSSFSLLGKKRISRRDVITVTVQFRQLLKAGVPLMEILEDLKSSYEVEIVREMLSSVYESMEGGKSFSESLAPYEKEFGTVYISLVSVGEQTGELEKILKSLEDMIKWEENLASKAKKVMIYPSIVAAVVLGVVIMMMIFVVPQLLTFIDEMGGEIGFATIALIATSNFVQEYILYILAFPFVAVFAFKKLLAKFPEFRMKFDQSIFRISIIGPVLYNLKIARIANSLAVMYGAGVGFTDSLRMAASVASNKYLEQNVATSIRLIEDGGKIHESFKEANVFPAMAIRMVKVGEMSGNMDEALNNVSEYYDTEAKEQIEKIEPAIEPLLTVIMAIAVGWVMIAVLGPVYDTISQVQ